MRPEGEVLRRGDYRVEPVPQAMAAELIAAFHYAKGGPNTGVARHGLFHRDNPMTCLGVAWWLPPTRRAAESVHPEWRGVLSLTRLAVAPEVPTNGASFLLAHSVKLLRRDPRWTALVTYADEGQGHTGAIYRASNWTFVGTNPGDPVWVDDHGRQVARKAGRLSRTTSEMRELGYRNLGRSRKHKYVVILKDPATEAAA